MNAQQLKERAAALPLEPGVYIMKDKSHNVIYVGKAKKLRNRVSQYFLDTSSHTAKTRMMVSKIYEFDVIVAASEFEALILECSLIKRYSPKYNILLKDDKGFPYIRLDLRTEYPRLQMVSKIQNDGAEYYGPFASRHITQQLLDNLRLALKLPNCNKKFPRDIGKDRVCLNYHMNQCAGWCQTNCSQKEYMDTIQQAHQLLNGNYRQLAIHLKNQMSAAAEALNFELAATLRDRLKSFETLSNKQFVIAGASANVDVVGFAQTESKACFAVLHFANGNLVEKEYDVFPADDEPEVMVSSLLKQYYINRSIMPKTILIPFRVDDSDLIAQMLSQNSGKLVRIIVPQRGDKVRLIELANKNAYDEAKRLTTAEEKISYCVSALGKMLSMDPPRRIESFDISNISGTDIVAGMIVYIDGKPKKSEYKQFKIKDLPGQDDYASMRQALERRFLNYINSDTGFDTLPDLLLIDGGIEHAQIAVDVLDHANLKVPVFGMVKDDKHRTRALVTADGAVINIDTNQSVFAFIGGIQEETHRFAISYHKKLRSKRLAYSELDRIPGIGNVRKELLLKRFKSISAISAASLFELEQLLPKDTAFAVFKHFHSDEKG